MTNLEEAGASVATWRDRVRTLNENISKAEAVAAASVRNRRENVLAASLGDDAAKINLAEVLEDDRKATRDLEDLRLALPLAEQELRTAENDHRVAEAEFRKAEVVRLARDRVEAARQIDQAFADFSAAWQRYESLGHQLYNAASYDHQNQIYLSETCDGLARLSAALPMKPFYDLRHRHSFAPIGTSSSLAAAESSYWRLPTDEAAKAAAA
jgi:hypothetical protein